MEYKGVIVPSMKRKELTIDDCIHPKADAKWLAKHRAKCLKSATLHQTITITKLNNLPNIFGIRKRAEMECWGFCTWIDANGENVFVTLF